MSSLLQNLTFEVSARSRNLIVPRLIQKMVYIHIPKCGGVSISKALKACYTNWNVRDPNLYKLIAKDSFKAAQILEGNPLNVLGPSDARLRQQLLVYGMSQPKIEFISGHFLFSLLAYQAFHHEYSFVTMLRDPVKRWISEYFYNRHKSYGNAKTNLDIKSYLDSDAAIKGGQTYAKFLCGQTSVEDYSSEDIIAQSKENLHKFEVVGCIEHLDTFMHQFSESFGRRLTIGKWNKNPKTKSYQNSIITDDVMNRIEQVCSPDIQIYNYAVDKMILGSNKR